MQSITWWPHLNTRSTKLTDRVRMASNIVIDVVCKHISSPTYENVVTQFLAGNFYCKFGIYNAKSMFCQNIVPLGQLEAEILIDLCSIKRSYSINRFLILSKGRMSLNDESFVPILPTIFVWIYYTKKYISKYLTSVHHNSSTLKGFFLRFYGSDPGDTTFWNSKFIRKCTLTLTLENTFFGSPENLYFLSYDIFICRRRYGQISSLYKLSVKQHNW